MVRDTTVYPSATGYKYRVLTLLYATIDRVEVAERHRKQYSIHVRCFEGKKERERIVSKDLYRKICAEYRIVIVLS